MYNSHNLSVLAYANGFTLWHYRSGNDSEANLASDGYFNHSFDMFRKGDMVCYNSADKSGVFVIMQSENNKVVIKILASQGTILG